MKKFLTILFSLTLLKLSAFHIVGGEMEFIYLSDGLYRINLIMYFDEAQDENPGPEGSVTIFLFENGSDQQVTEFTLPLVSIENVPYTNQECSIEELITSRIFYSLDVAIDPLDFNSEDGYYLVWERCCRNTTIKNIVSPESTGMTYTLEIPPLSKGNEIFQNSSPILFEPLSDYACINQLYYTEFTGIDPDGDSLVYSLATPLNSSSSDALPTPRPKPFLDVLFESDYSLNNMIPGSPQLRISNQGLLTVSPTETGLFVFSIRVEEYRNKEKIGETRRDFQMLVIDGCEPPDPPQLEVSIPGNPDFDPVNDVLQYTVGEEKCFTFNVSNITEGETISLRTEGVNFSGDINEAFSFSDSLVGENDELLIEVCIPDCPPIRDEPFIVDFIASDDACPLPQLDSIRLQIQVDPPLNNLPIVAPINDLNVDEDFTTSELVDATDLELDSMLVQVFVEGYEDPGLVGFRFDTIRSINGELEGNLIWETDCIQYDFSDQQEFVVGILVEDLDTCGVPGDTIYLDAVVNLPPNNDPVVTASNLNLNNDTLEATLGNSLSFETFARDLDNDVISLTFIAGNFNIANYTIDFENQEGVNEVSSTFSWDLPCDESLFSDGDVFDLLFIADDFDKCKIRNFDTLQVPVRINYPDNISPDFNDVTRRQTIRVNESVRIPIQAIDLDNDNLILSLADGILPPPSTFFQFETVTGQGSVESFIEWTPECSLFRLEETSTTEEVFIQVVDDACPISNVDTLKLTFDIIDNSERQDSFLPPNVFTPNNDGKNDLFRLYNNDDIAQNIPPDNCDNFFEYAVIMNRAGVPVYRSTSREIAWDGGNHPAGTYFLLIKFSRTEYKGYVQMIY